MRLGKLITKVVLIRSLICLLFFSGFAAATQSRAEPSAIDWKNALRQKPEWYESAEAVRIADNLLLYQRDTGSWAKNIDMATVLTDSGNLDLTKQNQTTDSTIAKDA